MTDAEETLSHILMVAQRDSQAYRLAYDWSLRNGNARAPAGAMAGPPAPPPPDSRPGSRAIAVRSRFRRPWLYPSEHMAKAEVYQEFAETFQALVPAASIRDKERRKREFQRHYMRMALVDPLVRDGLRAALVDADAYWDINVERPPVKTTSKRYLVWKPGGHRAN